MTKFFFVPSGVFYSCVVPAGMAGLLVFNAWMPMHEITQYQTVQAHHDDVVEEQYKRCPQGITLSVSGSGQYSTEIFRVGWSGSSGIYSGV